jgi:hypothetical protein
MFLLPIISKNVNYKNINNMNDNKVTLKHWEGQERTLQGVKKGFIF